MAKKNAAEDEPTVYRGIKDGAELYTEMVTVGGEPKTGAAARIRAFEDEVFGKRAVRIDGKIERGVGSPYAKMTEEQRQQYEALEKLAAAETNLAAAHAALLQAEQDHQAAKEKADAPR